MPSSTSISCAKIWTGADSVPGVPPPDTILFSGERILAVGSEAEVMLHPEHAASRKVRLPGVTIIPGLADSHLQFSDYARQRLSIDLSRVSCKDEMLSSIASAARSFGDDEWISGFNFSETEWDEAVMPDRHDLDSLNIPNPMLIQRICGHVTILNSRAMSLCSVECSYEADGVQLGFGGEPTGRLMDDAQSIALSRMIADMFDRDRLIACLREGLKQCASCGLTALFTCALSRMGRNEYLDVYQELMACGDLKARIFCYLDDDAYPRMASGFGHDWIRYQGYKIMLDGSLGARTAALSAPYSDAASVCGEVLLGEGELARKLSQLDAIGCQAKVHVIGDAALERLLDVLERRKSEGRAARNLPVVVNHCMVCRPDQIERMRALGIAATIQPTYVASDRIMAPMRLGSRIEKGWAYPWRSLVDAGVVVCGSSDSPFESIDPWEGIWAAVERETPRGVWMPEQCLGVEEAVRMYTVNSALATGTESWRGSLEPGKVADMVLLDRDIFTCAPSERRGTRVVCTIAGGDVTYGALA